jgi:hypothetical protein
MGREQSVTLRARSLCEHVPTLRCRVQGKRLDLHLRKLDAASNWMLFVGGVGGCGTEAQKAFGVCGSIGRHLGAPRLLA